MADLLAVMPGRWLLCGNQSVFAVNGGDVGLEITADNHWYKLYPAQGGATIRGAGVNEEGTWSAVPVGGQMQVNFAISGSGTVITDPAFASTPPAMRLSNEGVFVGNYVLDRSIPTGSVRCAAIQAVVDASSPPSSGAPDGGAEPLCTGSAASPLCSQTPTGSVAVSSMSDLLAIMPGRWLLCGSESVFGANQGDVGLEITADDHWYKLYPAQGGGTVRGAGFDEEGTWSALPVGDHMQVDFATFGSGTVITAPVFASTPPAMRLSNEGVFVGNYVLDPFLLVEQAGFEFTRRGFGELSGFRIQPGPEGFATFLRPSQLDVERNAQLIDESVNLHRNRSQHDAAHLLLPARLVRFAGTRNGRGQNGDQLVEEGRSVFSPAPHEPRGDARVLEGGSWTIRHGRPAAGVPLMLAGLTMLAWTVTLFSSALSM